MGETKKEAVAGTEKENGCTEKANVIVNGNRACRLATIGGNPLCKVVQDNGKASKGADSHHLVMGKVAF